MELAIILNRKEINELQFSVLVEMWDKKSCGKWKRAWIKELDTAERAKAGLWYKRFFSWHLVRGTPEEIRIKPETLIFLKKLIHFFGSM